MPSLSAHLRRGEGHAELPFHPGCPVCRGERVAGVPYSEGVVSRRTRAALTAGVLALSAAGPAGALAAEPDNDSQGAVGTEQAGHGDGASFDAGGAAVELPPTASAEAPAPPGAATALPGAATAPPGAATALPGAATAPPGDDHDDAVALDPDPANVNDTPVIDPGEEPAAPSAQQQPSPPPNASAVPVPAAPAESPDLGGGAPTAAAALPSIEGSAQRHAHTLRIAAIRRAERDAVARARHAARTAAPSPVHRGTARVVTLPWHRSSGSASGTTQPTSGGTPNGTTQTGHATGGTPNVATQPEHPSSGAPSGTTQPGHTSGGGASAGRSAGASQPTATVAVAVGASGALKRSERAHVVRPGESLWSVAKEVLGAGASTAQIAREVNRLWELNEASIKTGDPDLLMVGTRLRFR